MKNNHLYTEFKENRIAILSLFILLFIGFGTFLQASSDRGLQVIVASITCIGYFLWGILYHYNKGNLTIRIVLEYFAFACFFLTMSVFLVFARV